MSRVLMLDIDGVLNSQHFFVKKKKADAPPLSVDAPLVETMLCMIDRDLAFNLEFIFEHVPDLKIVISSTWRRYFELPQIREMFTALGIPGDRIIGQTPQTVLGQKFSEVVPRIAEISDYMREHALTWDEVAVLDDYPLIDEYVARWLPADDQWAKRFIQTDNLDGLTYRKAWDVILLFIPRGEFRPPVIML